MVLLRRLRALLSLAELAHALMLEKHLRCVPS